ncbi:GNAT family N-acetyltransferase [Hoeflea alexandrii]|uniref:GNAT family N-acetyltransferase n=1 Tax=Hoeflea alexandrii TaxID=288436 RepID=UPI0022B00D6A|nr:GNAT family N-acetyltransferase [Hoeflea alexandrii]MCZ4289805.1 GNAT family N-acetyltransferase [Hoeflea alexandrii]
MTGKVEIRPITLADEPEWRRLWTLYLEFYESSVPEEVYRTTLARIVGDHVAGEASFYEPRGMLALVDGKPAGLVHYFYHRHCWKIEQVCYLQDLYAAPDVRGTGVGRALIEAVYAQADADGCPSVYWMTQEFNATARKLYDRIATLTPFIKYSR